MIVSCSVLENLFDTLVLPVNLYCSELWGLENEFQDAYPFEYLHMKFIKESLGVHCKDLKAAFRAELARLPLESKSW